MKCGHLFNGIGGFALAASWMAWENIMHCEIDPFCNKVMNHHFPRSHQHEDIRTTDFTIWRGRLDLLTGGFPCQPYSEAGKRKGKDDDRHLWPEMLRAIREISPRWIVGENVRGLITWNGGMVFNEVQADLEAAGYEVLPFLRPAAGINAPHERYRIWFIAHSNSNGINRRTKDSNKQTKDEQERDNVECEVAGFSKERIITDADGVGLEGRIHIGDDREAGAGINTRGKVAGRNYKTDWADFPTQSPVCNRNDGLSDRLVNVPVHSKKLGIRILKDKQAYRGWRKESIKALGNAVVPQVVYQIFKAIDQYETYRSQT